MGGATTQTVDSAAQAGLTIGRRAETTEQLPPGQPAPGKKYTCPECGMEFQSGQGRGAHRKRVHGIAGKWSKPSIGRKAPRKAKAHDGEVAGVFRTLAEAIGSRADHDAAILDGLKVLIKAVGDLRGNDVKFMGELGKIKKDVEALKRQAV
ncbi:MAG TPA: C2H2-type zinc finger protein [Phycisphaerae bacterium]|nr:C2H2-type zinc finger protein [Phycisphaerae bacterium]